MSHWYAGWKFWPDRPGPLRVLLALFGVLITTGPAFLSFSILLGASPVVPRLIFGTAIGVYVNDAIARIPTMRAMAAYPWRLVTDVSTASRQSDPDAEGDRVVITVRGVGLIATPVRHHSMDFLGRPEPFSMASLAIERWWRDAGAMG